MPVAFGTAAFAAKMAIQGVLIAIYSKGGTTQEYHPRSKKEYFQYLNNFKSH